MPDQTISLRHVRRLQPRRAAGDAAYRPSHESSAYGPSRPGDETLIKRAFAPFADDRTTLLVLGSLPGDASLKAAQYYAHPQNAFWRLIGGVIGRDLHAMAYPDRVDALRSAGVGLWDVIASAERAGSLDASIRSPEAADLRGLIAGLPALRAVAFNGATAAKGGRKILSDVEGLTLIDLPSSSPAHATRTLSEKAESWAILKTFLSDAAA